MTTTQARQSAKNALAYTVAKRVKTRRISANISQADMARRLGLPQSTLMRYEAAIHPFTIDMVCSIAHVLKCEVTEFLSSHDGAKVLRGVAR